MWTLFLIAWGRIIAFTVMNVPSGLPFRMAGQEEASVCRIYVNTNINGCDVPNYDATKCVVDECGTLPNVCTFGQYISYGPFYDGTTQGTGTGTSYTTPTKGVGGTNLGIYTYTCPAGVSQYCQSFTGTVTCPALCPGTPRL